jgi:hypothetical protein
VTFKEFFVMIEERFNTGNVHGINHRHQRSVVKDPGNRKNVQTIPGYIQTDTSLPAAYRMLQQKMGPKYIKITSKDAYMLTKRFGVTRLKPGRPKGLKKTGIAIEVKPNGEYYLLKTKVEKPEQTADPINKI